MRLYDGVSPIATLREQRDGQRIIVALGLEARN
jgi:hypothetical protein